VEALPVQGGGGGVQPLRRNPRGVGERLGQLPPREPHHPRLVAQRHDEAVPEDVDQPAVPGDRRESGGDGDLVGVAETVSRAGLYQQSPRSADSGSNTS